LGQKTIEKQQIGLFGEDSLLLTQLFAH